MKGVWRVVESMVAAIILVTFMMGMASNIIATPGPSPGERGRMELEMLDARGELRPLVSSRDHQAIESLLDVPGYEYSVRVCCGSSCYGDGSSADDVWVSSYMVSGMDDYDPCTVRLVMW